jgi:hypothetical protein
MNTCPPVNAFSLFFLTGNIILRTGITGGEAQMACHQSGSVETFALSQRLHTLSGGCPENSVITLATAAFEQDRGCQDKMDKHEQFDGEGKNITIQESDYHFHPDADHGHQPERGNIF